MSGAPRTVVIGATGYTGRLVAHELARGDTPYLLTGRSAERLDELARRVGGARTRVVDVTDRAAIERALRPGDVVINCAGPFTDLGEPVVEACVHAGAHYLDTTGEQGFMMRVFERFDAAARERGVVVVNALAFEYALGDCAAALAAEGLATPLRSVDLVYAWGGSVDASRGTRLSVLRVVRDGGHAYRAGRWVPRRTASERRAVRMPDGARRAAVWFPAGEILTVPRSLDVERVDAWMVVGRRLAALAPPASRVLPPLMRAAEPLVKRWLARAPEGPTAEARRRSRFRIRAEAVGADGARRAVAVEGRDPYGLTAMLAVHAAGRLIGAAGDAAGVLAPARVLHAGTLREAPESWGIVLREEPVAAD